VSYIDSDDDFIFGLSLRDKSSIEVYPSESDVLQRLAGLGIETLAQRSIGTVLIQTRISIQYVKDRSFLVLQGVRVSDRAI
jgi:hypothetical protein